jgi:hypothetical protein
MMYRDNNFWTYFSTLSNSLIPNRPNMRLIAGVLRATVSGSTITWNWILDAQHDSIGFGAISCDGSNIVLSLSNPADKIHTILAVPDESLANAIDVGISFNTTNALMRVYRRSGVANAVFRGNGTTYVSTTGMGANVTLTYTAASGNLLFDWNSSYVPPASGVSIIYTGSNGYKLLKEFSGFSGNDRRYTVKDFAGNTVTANPTTSDVIEVVIPDWAQASINPCVAAGDGWAAAVFTAFSNIWVIGLIEY